MTVAEQVVVDGVAKTRRQWCEHYGITRSALSRRMSAKGISLVDAIRMGSFTHHWKLRTESLPEGVEVRPCLNHPEHFVTEDGRVWSSKGGRFLTPSLIAPKPTHPEFKYLRVNLSKKTKYVHILVAEVWVEKPENTRRVRHKDGDTMHNHKNNLVWY